MKSKTTLLSLLGLCCIAALGCSREVPVEFEPNFVHAMKYEIRDEVPMDQARDDVHWVALQMFGTPDQPKLPEFVQEDEELASLVSMDNLMKASGPIGAEGRGLYRKHCVSCHGVTGNGRGSNAAVSVPYPRDFRKGQFKFKSTPRGAKPTKDDIATLIRNGITGTTMVKIPELTDTEIDALVDYVIYLSWRGELERTLVDEAVFEEYDFAVDRIIAPEDKDLAVPEDLPAEEAEKLSQRKDAFVDAWDFATEITEDIAGGWLDAEDQAVEVPEPPADIPVTDSYEEYVAMKNSDRSADLAASVARGKELFLGKVATCSKCHGETGKGDGQTTDYDDWTKDWTLSVGLKPDDRDALIPMLARGALPPINAKPRNLGEGAFHGGESAANLYLRITQGIDGSPMPAATFVDGKFEEDDVWHLINFIRSIEDDAKNQPVGEPPQQANRDTTPPTRQISSRS